MHTDLLRRLADLLDAGASRSDLDDALRDEGLSRSARTALLDLLLP